MPTDQQLINRFRALSRAYEQAFSEWDDFAVQRTMNEMSGIAAELHARGYHLPSIMHVLQHSETETYLKAAS